MRRQRLRVELRLDGELKARYQGRYLTIGECDEVQPRDAHLGVAVSVPCGGDEYR